MTAAVAYPHIVKEEGKPARLEKHHRTRVSMIVTDNISRGWPAEEIVRQYPYLTHSEVYSALGYYHDHKEEIDQELAEEELEWERLRSMPVPPIVERLVALKARGGLKAEDAS